MPDIIAQDIRYALRGLRRTPAFSAAVVVTIALGVGANAAMFGIVDRMLFRPPPRMTDAARAHRIYVTTVARGKERIRGVGQYARYIDLAARTSSFSASAAFTEDELAVGIGDAAREMRIATVSASFFDFFDAAPALGRYFTTDEDQPPAGSQVAVLSHTAWRTQFGERRDVLGSKVQIGPVTYTIIGVAPQGFVGLWPNQPPAYFVPITTVGAAQSASMTLRSSWWKTYQWGWLGMIARRKPGVSIESASADLTRAMQESYRQELLESPRNAPANLARPGAFAASILSERGPNESNLARVATWVGAVAVIVLLVACANVANLLLARSIRRRREIAVRLALGVERARLMSQLLIESVFLAAIGGAAGIVVAQWGGSLLRAALIPGAAAPGPLYDRRTLAFGLSVAMGVGLVTGLAPLLDARRINLTGDLKSGARDGTFHRSRVRVALLVAQAAMSMVLLIGAGLFVRSLRSVQSLRLGYDAEPVAMIELNMRGVKLDSSHMVELRSRLLERANAAPGVVHAALTASIPFWQTRGTSLFVPGIDSVDKLGRFDFNVVSPDYFATMGTRIIRGRGFTPGDGPMSARAMVVSASMANTLWPGRDAIGQCIHVNSQLAPCTYIVGIAENIKSSSLADDPGLYYYFPVAQFIPQTGGLFVRTRQDASRSVETLRRELQREMPGASYVVVTPFMEVVGRQTQSWKLGATMFLVFGILALTLAAFGLYSVVGYTVAQRTHELGVRVALGAQAGNVIRLVVGEGVRQAGVGVVLGAMIAFGASRWVKPLLFSVSPHDPAVFCAVTFALLVVTVAASWIPARRAARVDPNLALRAE